MRVYIVKCLKTYWFETISPISDLNDFFKINIFCYFIYKYIIYLLEDAYGFFASLKDLYQEILWKVLYLYFECFKNIITGTQLFLKFLKVATLKIDQF